MKQRLWWHHIQRDKQYTQGIIKLDFDEAHIMWTQWRKVRLYQHLTQYSQFYEEFKDWAMAAGRRPMSKVAFGRRLRECEIKMRRESCGKTVALKMKPRTEWLDFTHH